VRGGTGRRRVWATLVVAVLGTSAFVGVTAGSARATTAPSQELPPLRALTPIGSRSEQGYVTGYPSFRWKFPSRDGTAQNWVTMDDTPLLAGVHLTGSGTSIYAYVTDWIYTTGIPLADGSSSGSGWYAYFYGSVCGGQENWAIFGQTTPYGDDCPVGSWDALVADLDALPGTWIPVGRSFEACDIGTAWYGGSCEARFIPSSEMSSLVTPVTDVEVWDTQPWDVLCPVSFNSPSCWTPEPPSAGYGVDVVAQAAQTPVHPGTTTDRFTVTVSNPNPNEVTVSSISAELPTGFTYAPGTMAGNVTSEPTVSGQTLTWNLPFPVRPGADLTFSFGVDIDPGLPTGQYAMTASAVTDTTYSATATLAIVSLTPLIFVPGTMGSKLSCHGDPVWPFPAVVGAAIKVLALADHGTTESTCEDSLGYPLDMTADDIVRGVGCLAGVCLQDEYDGTLSGLEQAGYVENQTLFVYPYDWRRSVEGAAAGLLAKIDSVIAQTGSTQVDILAHSQGGLVTRVALTMAASVGKVRRVLTMATPFYGAEKFLDIALTGTPCISNVSIPLVNVSLGCLTSENAVEEVSRTLPGAFDLLPSANYFAAVSPPVIRPGPPETFAGYQAFLDRTFDPVLVDQAMTYHAEYDAALPADPNVTWTQIVGYGKETIVALQPTNDDLHWATFEYTAGDGTVPAGSAVSDGLFTTMHTTGLNHMGIATDPCTILFAAHYFQDPSPTAYQSSCVHPGAQPAAARALAAEASAPDALELAVDGPLDTLVTDASGRTTAGLTDGTAIPDYDYNADGSSQSFLLRTPGSYHAVLTATGPGMARLRVRALEGGGVLSQALFLVPALPEGAVLTLDADARDVGATTVAVDLDGNGTTDEVLSPDAVTSGVAADDTTPPTVYGGATLAPDGTSSEVTLAAEDAASGVAHIYYRVGEGPERTYTGPFAVPMLSTISIRAMDEAGNMSDETSFVADDAPNTPRFADPILPKQAVLRHIDPAGDVDWFSFQADGSSRYKVQLDQLPAAYELQVFDAAGSLVGASAAHGNSPQTVPLSLPAGRYWIEVSGASADATDAAHEYRLQLLVDNGN
jgi:hypothetical protein